MTAAAQDSRLSSNFAAVALQAATGATLMTELHFGVPYVPHLLASAAISTPRSCSQGRAGRLKTQKIMRRGLLALRQAQPPLKAAHSQLCLDFGADMMSCQSAEAVFCSPVTRTPATTGFILVSSTPIVLRRS